MARDEAGTDALGKLADAIGQPAPSMVENAKALFPFIAYEARMNSKEPVAVAECAHLESHRR
ncbi:hypothetical protein [Streptomyces sp. SYSU K217416]